jgi:Co/Zn/Cd efflux system component
MLDWLESTDVALMVQESAWGYPVILSGHAVGMAVLVGIILMINFRVLGFASGIPAMALRPMFRVALIGLIINVISGTMLFMANANSFFESNPFRVKVVLLAIGGVLLASISGQLVASGGTLRDLEFDVRSRRVAALSIVVWIGVIVAGRLIAYLDLDYY